MDLKNFITLKTILETGSFQNAANKLGYTQSTITFQIHQLEQELSIQLFEKIGRKMFLTQAGKDILPYIDTIIQTLNQMNDYSKKGVESIGELKIAMPESLLTYKMLPVIKAFRQRYPNIKLSLFSLNCYAIKRCIINGEVDLGIHYDVGKYNCSIDFDEICQFPLSLIVSAEISKQDAAKLESNISDDFYLILNSNPQNVFREIAESFFNEKGMYFKNTIELGSVETIKKSVIHNLGITILPDFTIEQELNNNLLCRLNSEISRQSVSVLWARHKNKWNSPAMEYFMELVINELSVK